LTFAKRHLNAPGQIGERFPLLRHERAMLRSAQLLEPRRLALHAGNRTRDRIGCRVSEGFERVWLMRSSMSRLKPSNNRAASLFPSGGGVGADGGGSGISASTLERNVLLLAEQLVAAVDACPTRSPRAPRCWRRCGP
jgi:hypothetical protein